MRADVLSLIALDNASHVRFTAAARPERSEADADDRGSFPTASPTEERLRQARSRVQAALAAANSSWNSSVDDVAQ